MLRIRTIIALAVVTGFSLPHCAGGLLFVSTAMAAIPEAVSESQLQSFVNTKGTQDVCISYNPCFEEAQHHKHKQQCDECSVCIGQEQYMPSQKIIDFKDITLSFATLTDFIKSTESKYKNATFNNTKPLPLFVEARAHASTLVMLE